MCSRVGACFYVCVYHRCMLPTRTTTCLRTVNRVAADPCRCVCMRVAFGSFGISFFHQPAARCPFSLDLTENSQNHNVAAGWAAAGAAGWFPCQGACRLPLASASPPPRLRLASLSPPSRLPLASLSPRLASPRPPLPSIVVYVMSINEPNHQLASMPIPRAESAGCTLASLLGEKGAKAQPQARHCVRCPLVVRCVHVCLCMCVRIALMHGTVGAGSSVGFDASRSVDSTFTASAQSVDVASSVELGLLDSRFDQLFDRAADLAGAVHEPAT